MTADALKHAANKPELKGLAEVAQKQGGRAVLQKLRDVIFEAFRVSEDEIHQAYGLPPFKVVAKRVVEKWGAKVFEPAPQPTSDGTGDHATKSHHDAEHWKALADAVKIDEGCLEVLVLQR